ncbi:MAG: hypothetical protein LCH36_08910 [Actinobacteria bacterium]|nr:hypothetical protein [Actinomycetota bacterium]
MADQEQREAAWAAAARQQAQTFEPAVPPVFAQPTQYVVPPAYSMPGTYATADTYAAAGTYAKAGAAKLNSLAVVSLIVATIGALASFSLPFVANALYYAEAYAFIDFALNAVTWSFAIVSGALAAIALNPRHGTRWRSAAYAALGAAGYACVSSLAQTVAGGIMSAFSLY